MRTIKLLASYTAKVSSGQYENCTPYFAIEETIENCNLSDIELSNRQDHLFKHFCKDKVDIQAEGIAIEKIKKDFKNLRFTVKDGKQYIHVTSVSSFGSEFRVSPEDLHEYAAQGIINDLRSQHFVKTGEWLDPMKIEACWPHCSTLKSGKLKLAIDAADFPAFLKKYPIKNIRLGERFFYSDDEISMTGMPDFFGIPDFDGAEPIETVCDWKRSIDKPKNFMQMSAYAKNYGLKQMMICPLNDDTDQKFSKPVISRDVDGYYAMFLDKWKQIRQKHGL